MLSCQVKSYKVNVQLDDATRSLFNPFTIIYAFLSLPVTHSLTYSLSFSHLMNKEVGRFEEKVDYTLFCE